MAVFQGIQFITEVGTETGVGQSGVEGAYNHSLSCGVGKEQRLGPKGS